MSETYKPNGKPLTEYERELLTCLAEECAEVAQAACKLLRFGKESRPDGGGTNGAHLSEEIGHLYAVVDLLHHRPRAASQLPRADILNEDLTVAGFGRKIERLKKFLQHIPGAPK
jgi:hypothetical protein